ncbi:hypothetical protein H8356DRAFT_1433964 [Neocallimastix lanati (nom. inval.)]|nr:hypothetical protein H8356DRAFT_1433964 [Neocallimastix sp. JGI-2020a]
MSAYGIGYGIFIALVIDVNPKGNVKSAMNEFNTAQILRIQAEAGAETSDLSISYIEFQSRRRLRHERIQSVKTRYPITITIKRTE